MTADSSSPRRGISPEARARELVGQARVLTAVLWSILIVDASSATSFGRVSGRLLGTDFVQFYAAAAAAWRGNLAAATTTDGLHAVQLAVLPESAATVYPPVYPPQVALVLSPLGGLGYRTAYLAWVLVSLVLYALSVRWCVEASPRLHPWRRQAYWLAAGFPAAWFVALHGQLSAAALLAFAAALTALRRRHDWLAGVALGMLAFKPTLYLPALAIVALAGEWRIALAAVGSAAIQFAAAALFVDAGIIRSYFATMAALARTPDAVASNLALMHSLRTFWVRLLPGSLATALYAVSAAAMTAAAAWYWRRLGNPLYRVGLLTAAVVLISPHVFVYDLVILVPFLVASADVLLARADAGRLRRLVYAGYLLPMWAIPVAALGLQVSTLVLCAWFILFCVSAREAAASPPADR